MKIFLSVFKKDIEIGEQLAHALNELGHQSEVFYADRKLILPITKSMTWLPLRKTHGWYWQFFKKMVNKNLLKKINFCKPDLFISVGGEFVLNEVVQKIKDKYQIKSVVWVTDEPAGMADVYDPHRWLNFSHYDHLFVVDELWAQSLQLLPIPKTYLPFAGSNVYKPFPIKKDIDVLFVSETSCSDTQLVSGLGRALLLDGLLRSSVPVTALFPGVKNFFYYFPELKNYCFIHHRLRPEQINHFFNRSKVIIHINNLLLKTDFSDVVFNAGLSKSFIITDFKTNTRELFGENIVAVRTLEELVEKTKYYLADESQRLELARKLYETVLSQHTYKQRAIKIMETAGL